MELILEEKKTFPCYSEALTAKNIFLFLSWQTFFPPCFKHKLNFNNFFNCIILYLCRKIQNLCIGEKIKQKLAFCKITNFYVKQ